MWSLVASLKFERPEICSGTEFLLPNLFMSLNFLFYVEQNKKCEVHGCHSKLILQNCSKKSQVSVRTNLRHAAAAPERIVGGHRARLRSQCGGTEQHLVGWRRGELEDFGRKKPWVLRSKHGTLDEQMGFTGCFLEQVVRMIFCDHFWLNMKFIYCKRVKNESRVGDGSDIWDDTVNDQPCGFHFCYLDTWFNPWNLARFLEGRIRKQADQPFGIQLADFDQHHTLFGCLTWAE